jgi:hypothetical protein
MTRNTHDRQYDHHNVDLATNVILDEATATYSSGATVFEAIDSIDDRVAAVSSAASSGFTPILVTAECNNAVSTISGGGTVGVPWDAFYDSNDDDLSGVLPPSLGLVYSGATKAFTAQGPGVWLLTFGFNQTVDPGITGHIALSATSYGFGVRRYYQASGNDEDWVIERSIATKSGGSYYCYLYTDSGGSVEMISYAAMEIKRIADSLS